MAAAVPTIFKNSQKIQQPVSQFWQEPFQVDPRKILTAYTVPAMPFQRLCESILAFSPNMEALREIWTPVSLWNPVDSKTVTSILRYCVYVTVPDHDPANAKVLFVEACAPILFRLSGRLWSTFMVLIRAPRVQSSLDWIWRSSCANFKHYTGRMRAICKSLCNIHRAKASNEMEDESITPV